MAQYRQDMGSGPVKPLLLQLMIPAVVAQVVNLLYNIVDRIYIGHIEGIGAAALTGVGLFAPILMLLNAFAMLIGAGGAPRTAIALGQGNKDEAEKIIGNSFTMLLFFAVVLTAGFYAGAPALLRLFGASDATLPYAVAYGRIYILGSVFVLLVLEHAEVLDWQNISVERYRLLLDAQPVADRRLFEGFLDYAEQHQRDDAGQQQIAQQSRGDADAASIHECTSFRCLSLLRRLGANQAGVDQQDFRVGDQRVPVPGRDIAPDR